MCVGQPVVVTALQDRSIFIREADVRLHIGSGVEGHRAILVDLVRLPWSDGGSAEPELNGWLVAYTLRPGGIAPAQGMSRAKILRLRRLLVARSNISPAPPKRSRMGRQI